MNIKRSTSFFLEKRKKNGELITENVPIIMRVTFSGMRVDFTTGYRIDTDKWDKDGQKVKKGCTNKKKESASEINDYLNSLSTTIGDIFKGYEVEEVSPTIARVREDLNARMAGAIPEAGQTSAKRFQDAWDAFIEEESRSKDWTVATHRKYNAVRNRLKDFKTTLSFDDIEEKTLNKWVEFLQKQPMPDGTVGMKNSTVYKYIQFLRVFLNWATRKGYNIKLDYQSFRPNLKQAHNQPIYISQEEIHQLMDFKAPKGQERLEKIRDLFIFCCFSSLRWSDVCQLTRAHIDGDAIVLIQKKTAQTVRIELNKYTRTILEKYEDAHMPGGLALPVMSNQKMNDALKILFKQAGLDKPITRTYFVGNKRVDEVKPLYERVTTHVGRKTFVVIGLSNDISPYTITQWTGHSSLAAMKPYMAIADKEKKNAMKKFDEV